MDFDLPALLAAHRDDGYELYGRYLNPQQPKVLHAIGFDKVYARAEGAYLYDADGNPYADFLAGFGVFAAGRNHPVIRKALHDALDAQLADWTQFDCGPLPGLLAEKLLAKAPGSGPGVLLQQRHRGGRVRAEVRPLRHRPRPRPVLRPRLPRAHHRLAVGQRLGRVPPRLRPAAARRPDPARRPGRARGRAAQGRRGRADHRADPGQGRAHAARRLPDRRGHAAARPRRAAHLRRGAERLRAQRQVLRLPARGGRAGHRHRGQGAERRVRPGRRDAGQGAGLREGLLLDGPGHGAQHHVQGRRAGHDGRPGRARRAGRRAPDRERGPDRGGLENLADQHDAEGTTCWPTSAAAA